MGSFIRYRTLIAGILSPVMAAWLGRVVYRTLTASSSNRESDFRWRLIVTAAAMALPFVVTLLFAFADRKRGRLHASAKLGLTIATLSLLFLYFPIRGAVVRTRQTGHLAIENVMAPEVAVTDLEGKPHRLTDYRRKVVLLNVWATWCLPCRKEMPALDQLYQARRQEGLVVLGFSGENLATQQAFARQYPVSYPLLTGNGSVPDLLRDINRYPATFLIDRQGRLRRAPSPDEPFERIVARVDELLREN